MCAPRSTARRPPRWAGRGRPGSWRISPGRRCRSTAGSTTAGPSRPRGTPARARAPWCGSAARRRRPCEAFGGPAGVLSAPREIRTPTGHTAHKALNLARLPIPPQALAQAKYRSGRAVLGAARGALEAVREGLYCVRTHVRMPPTHPPGGAIQMVELNLTKRQQEIFDFIKSYGVEHGY